MAARTLERRIEELKEQCARPDAAEARAALHTALQDKRSLLLAAAANIIAQSELAGFESQLCAAYLQLLEAAAKPLDKGCHGKLAIARALYQTEARAREVFAHGVRHVQLEPIWGGAQDCAVDLRVTCALGLVRSHALDALLECARLLADREVMARIGAANAIAYSGNADVGLPLLLQKALAGDDDVRVTSACLAGLLALDAGRAIDWVAEFLESSDDALFEAAAVAIGESRRAEAVAPLMAACEDCVLAERRKVLLLALSMLRSEQAFDYLLELVRERSLERAEQALRALGIFAHDQSLGARIRSTLVQRQEPELDLLWRELSS